MTDRVFPEVIYKYFKYFICDKKKIYDARKNKSKCKKNNFILTLFLKKPSLIWHNHNTLRCLQIDKKNCVRFHCYHACLPHVKVLLFPYFSLYLPALSTMNPWENFSWKANEFIICLFEEGRRIAECASCSSALWHRYIVKFGRRFRI